MKSRKIVPLAFLLMLSTGSGVVTGESFDSEFEKTITKKVGLRYRTVTPANYDPKQKYPLLIFLHGRGEQGDNLDQVQVHGPFKKVAELNLPLIIVAPQAPHDTRWQQDSLSELVDHLLATLPVDKSRVYLTGLSMGGEGTWILSMHRPEVFAAIAPICGQGRPHYVESLRGMPIWMFHGDQDKSVRVHESEKMAQTFDDAGIEAKLTIYPGVGHNSWTQTYNNPELYKWLLSHRKSTNE